MYQKIGREDMNEYVDNNIYMFKLMNAVEDERISISNFDFTLTN